MCDPNSSGKDNNNNNCVQCNTTLREHLRKCAGLGERPAPFVGCCGKAEDKCAERSLQGPPRSTGCTPAPPKCCPPAPKNLVVFKPTCNVPATATFQCPSGACDNPKPKQKCCKDMNNDKPPEQTCCPAQAKCPEVSFSNGVPSSQGKCPVRNKDCGKGGCGKGC